MTACTTWRSTRCWTTNFRPKFPPVIRVGGRLPGSLGCARRVTDYAIPRRWLTPSRSRARRWIGVGVVARRKPGDLRHGRLCRKWPSATTTRLAISRARASQHPDHDHAGHRDRRVRRRNRRRPDPLPAGACQPRRDRAPDLRPRLVDQAHDPIDHVHDPVVGRRRHRRHDQGRTRGPACLLHGRVDRAATGPDRSARQPDPHPPVPVGEPPSPPASGIGAGTTTR
jgi:hypothetical protein